MRSIFRRILLWFGGILVFSLAALVFASWWASHRAPMRGELVRRLVGFAFEESVHAYETGGPAALQAVLDRLDARLPAKHYLADRQGRDLATGEDRSALLREAERRRRVRLPFPLSFPPPKRIAIRQISPDGRYVFLIFGEFPVDMWADVAFYGWIVIIVVLLSYALAVNLAAPLKELRGLVVRFGRGDLKSRAGSKRKDEFGDLARAFDQMADRIETLLMAERRLLQDISHELRSPLARLRFAVELARKSPDQETALARIRKEVDRISTLVGDLLEVTRAEGDPDSRELEALNLRSLLEEIADDCGMEADQRRVRIRLEGPPSIPCTADRELLHRAFENILRNALRHAPEDSQVDVTLESRQPNIVVGIRDYGAGVPEEHLPRIFRPFFRVEEDRSRDNGGGVGLGLAIAERAVRAHHGDIAARNMSPGLLVEVKLPL